MKRPIFKVFSVIFLFAIGIFCLQAQNNKYFFEPSFVNQFHADITVNENGEIDIVEHYEVIFNEESRGIFRYIPLVYNMRSVNGENENIRIQIKNIFIAEDDPIHIEGNNRFSDYATIRIGDESIFFTGAKNYTISYTVKNAILFNDTACIFYWNLIGNDWNMPFAEASATISFDPPLNDNQVNYYIYTGKKGEGNSDALSSFRNNKLNIVSTKEIGGLNKEDITILAYLPKGYIAPPNPFLVWLLNYYWIFLCIASSIYFYIQWKRHGKDNRIINTVEYLPPADIDPAIAGFMIDESADNHDIISLLPYWGSLGLIKIVRENKKDIVLYKIKNLAHDAPPYQRTIFDKIFQAGITKRRVSDLKETFAITMKTAKDSLKHECLMDYYTPESLKKQENIQTFFVLVAILGGIGIGFFTSIFWGIIFGVFHLLLAIWAKIMKKKSTKGDEILRITKGFRMFIDKAEKRQIEFYLKEDPLYFDKTIAYAIAFGMAKKWAKQFNDLTISQPDWYQDNTGSLSTFNTGLFIGSLMNSLNHTQKTFTYTPPSNSSSGGGGFGGGFSGGGFSGGGFGGGGGGRW